LGGAFFAALWRPEFSGEMVRGVAGHRENN